MSKELGFEHRWCIGFFMAVVVGTSIQLALWKTSGMSVLHALFKMGYLWVFYLPLGILLAEPVAYVYDRRQYHNQMDENTQAIHDNPKDVRAYCRRADALECLGRHQDAITDYTQAIAIEPGRLELYLYRGGTYFRMGRRYEAKTDFDHAASIKGLLCPDLFSPGAEP